MSGTATRVSPEVFILSDHASGTFTVVRSEAAKQPVAPKRWKPVKCRCGQPVVQRFYCSAAFPDEEFCSALCRDVADGWVAGPKETELTVTAKAPPKKRKGPAKRTKKKG